MDVNSQLINESRVLVIYTGGTIGMLVGHQGYVPEPYFLTETLRSQARFHDPLQNSLFSNSGSVQGFREWSSGSGRSSPSGFNSVGTETSISQLPTLPVRSARPIGHSASLIPGKEQPSSRQPISAEISKGVYEAQLPSLVTPRSAVPGTSGTKCIRYAILEWDSLLDSSNIQIEDWVRIATEIELNYANFDAFVILHGTDTMGYSASALSFLLEDLGKTVILTGAQIPLSQLRNDATDNLMGALTIAGHYIIPECSLYFDHTLFRGNRVSKMSSYDLNAFDSPNFAPLVKVGIDIVVNWNDVIRPASLRRFKAHKEMSAHVATLRLFPGITAATVRAFFMPPMQGVVLETFGSGNAPQRADLMGALKEACDRGVVVVAISQCARGSVSDAYETGRTLQQAGVVPGGDMTPECALAKLSYLLSKPELSMQEVRKLMGVPLRGELTRPSSSAPPSQISIEKNLENLQGVLSRFISLSQTSTKNPAIVVSDVDNVSQDAAAPWSWTAAEASSIEAVLFPFLIHLAVSKNNVDALKYCLDSSEKASEKRPEDSSVANTPRLSNVAGGLVNCLEPGSGRTPLHIAALNGHTCCIDILLHSGALVHLRDGLGHTALYYAARQNHLEAVEMLVAAGATLSGSDGPFAKFAVDAQVTAQDPLRTWTAAGLEIPRTSDSKAG
ncbi:60 kda lysophospholipase-like [Moniliophthora roreri MCA 2997]|uniref:asparaginase n=1 Tax=Moniliophthora roreri (strain MCA 2997) TaxID=1381753 RepID=V2X5I5_MONRO|nr:60 kda lysophospholipase-like [Moniliophthora roreri MCA 2997]